jgi:hypothetical protein
METFLLLSSHPKGTRQTCTQLHFLKYPSFVASLKHLSLDIFTVLIHFFKTRMQLKSQVSTNTHTLEL